MKDKDFRLVLVPLISSVMIASGACYQSPSQDDQVARVCVDKNTGQRVEDNRCHTGYAGPGMGFVGWYFLTGGGSRFLPPVGSPVRGGSFQAPPNYRADGTRASSRSGSTTRGGFGSSASGRAGG